MSTLNQETEAKGRVNEFGYEEFDSRDFRTETALDQGGDDEGDADESGDDETKEAASGDLDQDKGEEEADGGAPNKDDKTELEGKAGDDGEESQDGTLDKGEYQPNHTYKVYDQVKEFPEEIKALVKDKESEEVVRSLLSKADALEPMKAKQVQATQERDQAVYERDTFRNNFQRAFSLKDQSPELFCAEFQITPEWILRMANKIADAKETPESWARYQEQVGQDYQRFASQIQFENEREQFNNNFRMEHDRLMTAALSEPQVQAFSTQYDNLNGAGAFREMVRRHGDLHYQQYKQNLPPAEAVNAVMKTFIGFGWTPPASQNYGGSEVPPKTETTRRERPKTIPNTGRGRNVAPTRSVPKTFADMKKKIAAELAAED